MNGHVVLICDLSQLKDLFDPYLFHDPGAVSADRTFMQLHDIGNIGKRVTLDQKRTNLHFALR